MVTPSCPSEALLWGRSTLRSPPSFVGPGEPREPLCLCMLLFPLHAQTPSPPRCARTGLEQFQASLAAPGSRRPSHSAGGTANPTGSGLDLSQKKTKTHSPHFHSCLLNQKHDNSCQPVIISLPLKGDSSTGAGLRARNSFLAYLLSAPLFSVGTMSWRMKRARSRMS